MLFQEVSHLTVGNAVVLNISLKANSSFRRIEDNKGEPTVEVSLLTLVCCGIMILIDSFYKSMENCTCDNKALLYSLKYLLETKFAVRY